MTTKPARPKCSTNRLATILAMIASAVPWSNSPHDAGSEVRSSAEKDLGAVVPSPSTAQFSSVYRTEQWPPGSSSTLESVGHFL